MTSGFAPAFQDPQPVFLYDLSQDMQGDFKLHIVDPSIIVAPLANSAIEIQEEKKENPEREITVKSKQELKKKFQELIS
jgi:hypothetical protein